ncbi:hypothetical protein Clacol_009916 [Clathrus columnatus]|uniref:Bulb-type lectin domain-containing protein n=1 Tax=Clathrus columnatus TaxID=1419009 RepID=A0AAV5ARI4_9AGAM|nr:hypothetical protein Clacol_009916 [Clathrus columnatus]
MDLPNASRPPIPPKATKPGSLNAATDLPIMPKVEHATFPNSKPPQAGTLYLPGKWPTPELSTYPIGRYSICNTGPFTSETLQSALNELGPSSILYLPSSSRWDIIQPIKLKEHQELATWGYPTEEHQMALLEAGKDCYPFIINAWAITGAKVRNIIVDGGRQKHGNEPKCGVMLQLLIDVYSATPDTGSHNVRITNNKIGPAGISADKRQGEWADGISFAGSNGLVAGNEIIDATDGAIVVFGAPGTLVTCNTIISQDSITLGGINMVDFAYEGSYSGTRVVHNTLISRGPSGYFKTGIGQGPSVWWTKPSDKVNYGGVVMYNLIDSQPIDGQFGGFGYGFPVSADVRSWICVGNVSLGHVPYTGDLTKSLPWPNAPPGPFVYDGHPSTVFTFSAFISSSDMHMGGGEVLLQSDFMGKIGRIASLISIQPGPTRVLSYRPGQLRLKSGQIVTLTDIIFSYDHDGYIRVRQRNSTEVGFILWEMGFDHVTTPGQHLHYTENGKLVLSSTQGQIHDLTPHIKSTMEGSSLVISNVNPYLTISGPKSSLLFASAYIFPQNRTFALGQIVARTYMNKTLIYALSPYCQFVVLRSKQNNTPVPSIPFAWPDKEREAQWEWEVVWRTPNTPTERRDGVVMSFQGDGNLVIYSNKTVPWASGTHGRIPPAVFLRLGFGSTAEPWLELITDEELYEVLNELGSKTPSLLSLSLHGSSPSARFSYLISSEDMSNLRGPVVQEKVIVPTQLSRAQFIYAYSLITSLFFAWGFAYGLLDSLNKHFQTVFGITKTQSTFMQVSYFGIFGHIFFGHHGQVHSCDALVISCREAQLCWIRVLGDPKYGAMRLTFSQAWNGIGAFAGPLIASQEFFKGENDTSLANVQWVYLAVAKLPEVDESKLPDTLENQADVAPLHKQYHLIFGFWAQFSYVGAQVAVATFCTNFFADTPSINFVPSKASLWYSYCQMVFALGRFLGAFVLRWVDPAHALTFYLFACCLFTVGVVVGNGTSAVTSMFFLFFFESICWPTIYALAISRLGYLTKQGGSFVVSGVGGGALYAPLQGVLSDSINVQIGYWVAFVGYANALAYGVGMCIDKERRKRIDSKSGKRIDELDRSSNSYEQERSFDKEKGDSGVVSRKGDGDELVKSE